MAVKFDTSFLWQPTSDNGTQVYLHVSNMAWEPSRSQVDRVYPRLTHPEFDYPMVVFMAHVGHTSLSAVWKTRSECHSWAEVAERMKIPRDRIVVEPKRREGPPYGKAHGYWAKHAGHNGHLSDDDLYYWANVHIMSAYFGYDPELVVSMTQDGGTFEAMAVKSFKSDHGKAKNYHKKSMDTAGMGGPPPGKPPRGRGNGRGHNDRDR